MSRFSRFAFLIVGAFFALGAVAQPAPPNDASDQPDPPSRVARLSYIRGAVSFVPAGENDWVEAQINRPLVTGDKLWTDNDSRAELQIGTSAVRIDQQTSFDFLNLDDQTAQVELTQGALNLRVRRLYDNQVYEIDTPTLAFVINRVGEYRVTVAPSGLATIVSVMHGGGDAYGEGGARFRIEEGQSVTFNDSQLRDYETTSLPPPDAFDDFIAQRDGRWDRSRAREYVAEDVIGYEDLDDNGEWSDAPEYGHVWYPTTVAVGWVPYHYGHWGWVGAYGWTWIDDSPWGFAPFHYGRWAYIGDRWGWCPGPIGVRAYYAPALVAFIGGGVSIGIGGPVGWFALGPRDVYFPGYHVSQSYFAEINFSGSRFERVEIDNYYGHYHRGDVDFAAINYHNRAVAGAVIAVPAAAFVGARAVHASAIAVNRETFGNAHVSAFAAVAPTRTSLVAASAQAGRVPPAAVLDRHIVAASRPPAPVASFASREALLQKNPGQPLGAKELRSLPAVQNGARSAEFAGRQNVKVVTSNGAPARTLAPALTGNANNGKGGPANIESRRIGQTGQNPPQTNKAVTSGVGNSAATGTQNDHLQSSRFVHSNSGTAGNATGNPNVTGKTAGSQTSTSRGAQTYNQSNTARQTTNAAALNNGQTSNNGGQGQGNTRSEPKYKSAQSGAINSSVGSSKPGGNGNGQNGSQRSTGREYRATQGGQTPTYQNNSQNSSGQGKQPYQQQPVQQVQHVQQPAQQPQYHAPVQPQVQQHSGGQPQAQGNNNNGGKHSKDDDKKKGGGGR